MENKHAEELCALMDGELGRSESLFLLKRMGHEKQLVTRWQRYHFSRSVLRGEELTGQICLRAKISDAIADEPTPIKQVSGPANLMPAWLRPVAGMAVAASVAVAAFSLLQTDQATTVNESTTASSTPVVAEQLPSTGLRAQTASGGSQSRNPRLQAYVMRHNAVATPRHGRDLVPYVYLVSTPIQETDTSPETSSEAARAESISAETRVDD
jgi:sigma-E factor negative regulatory protein RseA